MISPAKKSDIDFTRANVSAAPVADISKVVDKTSPWVGVFWKVFSCACFASTNGLVRYLTAGSDYSAPSTPLPAMELIFFENFFGVLLMLPWILKKGWGALKTKYIALHTGRIITALGGIFFLFHAMSLMPIPQAIGLSFTGPIFTILAAKLYLREKIGTRRVTAFVLTFGGALLISRPDVVLLGKQGLSLGWTGLLPLMSALSLSFTKVFSRKLTTRGESTHLLTVYLLVFVSALACALSLSSGAWVSITVTHIPWLILMGALTAAAYYGVTQAFQKAEVSFLMPFGSSKLLFCMLISYIGFREIPESLSVWIGLGSIALSTLILSLKTKKV